MVWTSAVAKELSACRMHIVQPVSASGAKAGRALVAADPQHLATAGDTVIYVTSTDAAAAFDTGYAPVNASVVGIVEEIS